MDCTFALRKNGGESRRSNLLKQKAKQAKARMVKESGREKSAYLKSKAARQAIRKNEPNDYSFVLPGVKDMVAEPAQVKSENLKPVPVVPFMAKAVKTESEEMNLGLWLATVETETDDESSPSSATPSEVGFEAVSEPRLVKSKHLVCADEWELVC